MVRRGAMEFCCVATEALLRAEEQFGCLAFNFSLRSLQGITSTSQWQTPTNNIKYKSLSHH